MLEILHSWEFLCCSLKCFNVHSTWLSKLSTNSNHLYDYLGNKYVKSRYASIFGPVWKVWNQGNQTLACITYDCPLLSDTVFLKKT